MNPEFLETLLVKLTLFQWRDDRKPDGVVQQIYFLFPTHGWRVVVNMSCICLSVMWFNVSTHASVSVQVYLLNPIENLRGYINNRPPLVIFMISVSAVAIAFLTIGYFFKIKEIKSPELTEVGPIHTMLWKEMKLVGFISSLVSLYVLLHVTLMH